MASGWHLEHHSRILCLHCPLKLLVSVSGKTGLVVTALPTTVSIATVIAFYTRPTGTCHKILITFTMYLASKQVKYPNHEELMITNTMCNGICEPA